MKTELHERGIWYVLTFVGLSAWAVWSVIQIAGLSWSAVRTLLIVEATILAGVVIAAGLSAVLRKGINAATSGRRTENQ
jgi:hypothetical protein